MHRRRIGWTYLRCGEYSEALDGTAEEQGRCRSHSCESEMKVDMAWEWNWPRMLWNGNSQTNFFSVDFYHQKEGDHSPGWHFSLIVWNCCLLDFGWYNRHHEECTED